SVKVGSLQNRLNGKSQVLEQDTQSSELVSSHNQNFVLERDTQNPVPEQKTPGFGDYTDVPEHILPVPEHLHWVEKYCPSNRKDNHYYRYCWKTGGKIKHQHIAGGNVRSQLAQSRKQEVEIAIADGQPPKVDSLLALLVSSPHSPFPNAQCPMTNDE
ncbi:MAG: hypothetical protein RM049_30800, partial [Nostoc sp. DedQUE04]|nr:hypothetical protein [Nostoc sp. DedQUE04]